LLLLVVVGVVEEMPAPAVVVGRVDIERTTHHLAQHHLQKHPVAAVR